MPPGLHAFLGASNSNLWLNCTVGLRLAEKILAKMQNSGGGDEEDSGSSFAREGTKAHELGELKLRHEMGELNDFAYTARREELERRSGPIDKEMEDATDSYVSVVMERYYESKRTCPDTKLMIETRLDYSKWVPHGFGTGDVIIVSDHILDVCDLKYGVGIPVSAVDNPQPRLYALGALDLLGDLYDFEKVRATIIQPRLDSVTEETLTRDQLLQWAEDEVRPRAQMAWEGTGDFAVGGWCQWCPIKAICMARAKEALNIFTAGMEDPAVLSDEQIPQILSYATMAKKWINDLENYAQEQAIKGRQWKGYKLVRGRSNRVWSEPEELADNLMRAGYKREDIYRNDLRSVSDIEKMLGKKAFRAFAEQYTYKPEGKLTLVPESDKRPAVNSAKTDFGDLGDIE